MTNKPKLRNAIILSMDLKCSSCKCKIKRVHSANTEATTQDEAKQDAVGVAQRWKATLANEKCWACRRIPGPGQEKPKIVTANALVWTECDQCGVHIHRAKSFNVIEDPDGKSQEFNSIEAEWHHSLHSAALLCDACERLNNPAKKVTVNNLLTLERELTCTFCNEPFIARKIINVQAENQEDAMEEAKEERTAWARALAEGPNPCAACAGEGARHDVH